MANEVGRTAETGYNGIKTSSDLKNLYSAEDQSDALEEKSLAIKNNKADRSEIQNFFADKHILITGGTGFLGKVLIEKLLRSCPELKKIYMIIRTKEGKDINSRITDMLEDVLFERVLAEDPKIRQKLLSIYGNFLEPDLGLSDGDRKLLTQQVSIIIHSAATVRFDDTLSIAGAVNVGGTRYMLDLAKECQKLEAFTHVSSAFSYCIKELIEEKFYEPPIDSDQMLAISSIKDDNMVRDITSRLLGDFPNTYCFTKAIGENAIQKYGAALPICVIRPSIVVSTYEEPIRGWTDNMYGPTGLCVAVGTGVVRTLLADENKLAEIVPVDYTVNAVIAATFDTAHAHAQLCRQNETSNIPIYNFVSTEQNPLTWKKFIDLNEKNSADIPTMRAIWYYGLSTTNSRVLYFFYNFFLQFLPALIADIILFILGKERRIVKLYRKGRKLGDVLSYFSRRQWRFEDGNCRRLWQKISPSDREVFPFDISQMSWEYYFETLLLGLRVYLVKDDLSTLPEARQRWRRLFYYHQLLKILYVGFIFYLSYYFITYILALF